MKTSILVVYKVDKKMENLKLRKLDDLIENRLSNISKIYRYPDSIERIDPIVMGFRGSYIEALINNIIIQRMEYVINMANELVRLRLESDSINLIVFNSENTEAIITIFEECIQAAFPKLSKIQINKDNLSSSIWEYIDNGNIVSYEEFE